MGIPKFYRWTSERYPCLYEKIREYQIPEFDNLYLDMNGIIHNCSHPNDEDIHLRIPEENIFRDIFHYIDFLFRMIKPCKVFFMAIDGVAPRAKMNQQRGRRFRSARVAEEQEAEALRQGEKLPSEERFDSNCITPGTEFMARLHEQLKYFVSVKVSTDPLWQKKGLCIYLSGHDVPGEGEHKIMDFIRHIRSQRDYDPETRHCLYGLDADLMMLGLSTHELRFALLREEVKFTKPKKKKNGKQSFNRKKSKNKNSTDNCDNNVPIPYDLTNVSIFSNESNLKLPDSILKPLTTSNPTSLTSTKSFLDVINTVQPPPEVSSREQSSINKQEAEAEAPPPPPVVDEYNAKGDYKAPLPEKTTFFLLHLSLFRDYLDEEFKELRDNLKKHPVIKYDLESLIDDWILMNILVGNDFVPHLPNLHIVKGALPMLYRTYMEVLPTLDGYLNENGILNLKRFETFITRLSQFDLDQFRETYDDMKYKASKTGKNIVLGEKMFEDFIFEDGKPFEEEELELEPISNELRELAKRTEDEIFGESNSSSDGNGLVCKEAFPEDQAFFSTEDSEEFRLEFLQHKRNYYLTKCEFKKVDRDAIHDFAKEYVRAIQWVLLYYYKGVSSWGWFYPSHYAPFASDLRRFGDYQIEFSKGNPFKPFEQLLAVLPSQSKKLLPNCYQWLMTEESSPILEYYPKKFEQDLNGKKQDWEAVVLIPFIDESKLLTAMQTEAKKLTEEERFRNLRGALLCYSYTKVNTGPIQSHRNIFPALEESHVKLDKIDEVEYNPKVLPKGLHPKANVKKIYQGFPTLKSKSFESTICKAEVKVFEFYAREESLIISLEEVEEEFNGLQLAKKVLGKQVWVNWPHLEAALVTAIYSSEGKYILGRDNIIIKDPKTSDDTARKTFSIMVKGLVERHLKFRGIRLGDLQVILYARVLEGRKIRCNNAGKVTIENQWSKIEQPFALKTTIFEERVTDMFYLDEETARTYLDLFRIGDQIFYLGDKQFGAMGQVTGHDKGSGCVVVELKYPKESDESNLKLKTGLSQLKSQDFFPPYMAATKCGISSFALSRLTGRVLVAVEKVRKPAKKFNRNKKRKDLVATTEGGSESGSDTSDVSSEDDFPALEPEVQKFNIGLDLKFNKTNMEVRGYTSKREGQWYYSVNTIQLVNEYANRFPNIVELLGRADKNKDVYNAADIFPSDPYDKTMEIVQWLEDTGVRNLPKIPTNCNVLDDEDIDIVWKYVSKRSAETKDHGQTWTVRPNLLYKPGLDKGCIAPIPNAQFALLDRVICVDRGASIPLGLRGTVVGIQAPPKSNNNEETSEEAFKSISADALNLLIIMCDPVPDIFDTPRTNLSNDRSNGGDELKELTSSISKLLNVGGGSITKTELKNPVQSGIPSRPKLVKLFPYQVINLTQGSSGLRQNIDKVSVPTKNREKASSLVNGTVIVPLKSYAQSVAAAPAKRDENIVKVLRNPNPRPVLMKSAPSEESNKNKIIKVLRNPKPFQYGQPETQANAQPVPQQKEIPPLLALQNLNIKTATLPWPPKPKNRSITVEELFAQAAQTEMTKGQKNQAQAQKKSKPEGHHGGKNPNSIPTQIIRKEKPFSPKKSEQNFKLSQAKEQTFKESVSEKQESSVLLAEQFNKLLTEGATKMNSSSKTKVFVNSALKGQSASPNKISKSKQQQPTPSTSKCDSNNGVPGQSQEQLHQERDLNNPNNQILNLLCQPKNMQIVKTTNETDLKTTVSPTVKSATTAINGKVMQNPNHQHPPPQQTHFQHPVHFIPAHPGHPVQIVSHHHPLPPVPVMFVAPTQQGSGFAVWNPNPLASAFMPHQFQQIPHSPAVPMTVHSAQAPMFPPPPPPQHWTHHQQHQGQHSHSTQGQSFRQTKGTHVSNVFVPLQVSRSMASSEPEATMSDSKRKAQTPPTHQPLSSVIKTQSQSSESNANNTLSTKKLAEDTPVTSNVASSTLKALLGVSGTKNSTTTAPETVPSPIRKPSRIAANFCLNQPC